MAIYEFLKLRVCNTTKKKSFSLIESIFKMLTENMEYFK